MLDWKTLMHPYRRKIMNKKKCYHITGGVKSGIVGAIFLTDADINSRIADWGRKFKYCPECGIKLKCKRRNK